MKEIIFVDNFCEFLEERRIKYKRELWRGTRINEGYVDIVISKSILIGVEAKLNNFKGVLNQAWINTLYFPLSYILYPRFPSYKNIKKLKKTNIGLIIPRGKKFRIVRKPKFNKTCFYDVIKRNWNENRVGRIIHKFEIPIDYDLKKIEKLKCSYDWLKSQFELDLKYKKQKRLIDFIEH
ncbi:MAG: hypothetical protein ACTSRG_17745 [Candidatus Helarchaeota archaeon]